MAEQVPMFEGIAPVPVEKPAKEPPLTPLEKARGELAREKNLREAAEKEVKVLRRRLEKIEAIVRGEPLPRGRS